MLGLQRPREQHRDRGGRGRTDTDLRDEPVAGGDLGSLAWDSISPTEWTASAG